MNDDNGDATTVLLTRQEVGVINTALDWHRNSARQSRDGSTYGTDPALREIFQERIDAVNALKAKIRDATRETKT